MNREETKAAIKVMQAFVDGDDIEHQHDDAWVFNGIGVGVSWLWETTDKYRIKPMPREWWLNTASSECYVTKECAEKFSGGREVVWVREVL